MFPAEYLHGWLGQARELLKDPRVRASLKAHSPPATDIDESALLAVRAIDRRMRNYAQEWFATSALHVQDGLYRRALRRIGPVEGLLVDVGCGIGGLIEARGSTDALGVDINGYSLQLAEGFLRGQGMQVRRLGAPTLAFDYERGLTIRPSRTDCAMREGEATLLCDDAMTLENTVRVLAASGRKAQTVTMLLSGGTDNHRVAEFGERDYGLHIAQEGEVMVFDALARKLPEMLEPGGAFYLGIREGKLNRRARKALGAAYEEMVGANEIIGASLASCAGSLKEEATWSVPMLDERDGPGVGVFAYGGPGVAVKPSAGWSYDLRITKYSLK